MKRSLIVFIIIILAQFTYAGNDNYTVGARNTGMGNTGLCLSDVWSIRNNQAGLADVKLISAGVSYESRFATKQLGIQSFALALPTKSGTFGLNYTGFGDRLYNESKIGLGYGMRFSEKISGGIRINYHSLTIGNGYGTKSSLTFEAGLIANLSDKITLGVHLFNPTQSKLNDYQNEIIPTVLSFGLSYKFSDKVFVNGEVEKDIDRKPVLKTGVEYHPLDVLYIRAGVSSNPSLPSIGFGVDLQQFRFDFSSSFHPVLGATPSFALVYSFKK
jgi:hypothetical protein